MGSSPIILHQSHTHTSSSVGIPYYYLNDNYVNKISPQQLHNYSIHNNAKYQPPTSGHQYQHTVLNQAHGYPHAQSQYTISSIMILNAFLTLSHLVVTLSNQLEAVIDTKIHCKHMGVSSLFKLRYHVNEVVLTMIYLIILILTIIVVNSLTHRIIDLFKSNREY